LRDLENVEKEVATEVNEGGMMSYYESRINSQFKVKLCLNLFKPSGSKMRLNILFFEKKKG